MDYLSSFTRKELILLGINLALFAAVTLTLVFYDVLFESDLVNEENSIAIAKKVAGRPVRRLAMGFTFRPLRAGYFLANGDRVFTSPRSSLTVKFENASIIRIAANSLVDIRVIEGTIDLFIANGEGSGSLTKEAKLEIHNNQESMKILAESATTFSVSQYTDTGLTLTEYKTGLTARKRKQTSGSSSKPREKPAQYKRKQDTATNKITGSGSEQAPDYRGDGNYNIQGQILSIDETLDVKEAAYNYALPYPGDQTVFLYSKPSRIPIILKKKCLKACEVKVEATNGTTLLRKFSAGQTPFLALKFDEGTNTKVRWTLIIRDTPPETGLFFIQPYSEKTLQEGILSEKNIEVLD